MRIEDMKRDRLARRLTWADYAKLIGVSRQTLHNIRNGMRPSELVKAKIEGLKRDATASE